MDSVVQALLQLGIAGAMAAALIWLLWYTLSKTVPSLLQAFREENRVEREACEKRHLENLKHHETMIHSIQEMRTYLNDGIKENRHAIVNLAHAAKLKNAIDEQEMTRDRNNKDNMTP